MSQSDNKQPDIVPLQPRPDQALVDSLNVIQEQEQLQQLQVRNIGAGVKATVGSEGQKACLFILKVVHILSGGGEGVVGCH